MIKILLTSAITLTALFPFFSGDDTTECVPIPAVQDCGR